MSVYHRSTAKSRILQEYHNREEEIAAALSRQMSPKAGLESEKRMRREIANSNERRRMQSINAGFQLLRSLIPHNDGEKLSKAAILQQATDYIRSLQQDKAKILAQNAYIKRLLSDLSQRCNIDLDYDISLYGGSPPSKRKKRDTESSDEGISADFEDYRYEDMKRELVEVKQQLNRERQLRLILENRSRSLEDHRYQDKVMLRVGDHIEHQLTIQSDYSRQSYVEEPKREEAVSYTPLPLKVETESDHRVPSSPPLKPERVEVSHTASSMSRRNLETIVEAIRHLEGDENTRDQKLIANAHSNQAFPQPLLMAHCEESEKDSSITSDQDDLRSESSGRDSPSPRYVSLQNVQQMHHLSSPKLSTSKVVVTSASYSDRYPAVTNVLQGNASQPHVYYRPGVIVQKS